VHHCKAAKPRARAPVHSRWAALITAAMGLAVLAACGEPFYCTPGAATWQVTVLDAQGAPVPDLRWTAVIERTHDTIPATLLAAQSDPTHGAYAILTDAVRDRIDPTGEVVRVEGAAGTEWFSAAFTFAVPQADCYANRVSGPDTVTLAPAAFALVNADRVWGGGDILVVSPVLRMVDSLPFLVDGDTAWSHAIAGDTAALTAPVNTGAYGVEVVRGAAAELLGTAAVRGYGGYAMGPPMSGVPLPWPTAALHPTYLGNGVNRLQLFDAATQTVIRSFPDSIHSPGAPGSIEFCPDRLHTTYDERAVVLCQAPAVLQAWTLVGEPAPFDVALNAENWGVHAANLATPGGPWLVGFHHYVTVVPPGFPEYVIEGASHIKHSPAGDRIVVMGNGQLDGVLVLDTADVSIPAYYIEELAGGGTEAGTGFSADGAILYAASTSGLDPTRIVAVDAADGTTRAFRDDIVRIHDTPALLVDPRGQYVFMAGHRYFDRTVLVVLDAQSLSTMAELELPVTTCASVGGYPAVGLVLDQVENRVFAVWTSRFWQEQPPDDSCIEWFDLW
jgi:hypothetical protein